MSETTATKSVSLQAAIDGQLSPAERTALYQRYLETEQEKTLALHREGAGGVEVSSARAKTIDTLLAAILEATIKAHDIEESPLALVATGGYGRGTLNPGSDIDLLFLLPRASSKLPKAVQDLVQRVLYPLWDMGFKVGHACRSIAECIQEARSDQQNFTSLMDTRLIAGNQELYDKFIESFEKNCIAKGHDAFFEKRRTDLNSRYKKSSTQSSFRSRT